MTEGASLLKGHNINKKIKMYRDVMDMHALREECNSDDLKCMVNFYI